MKGMNEKGLVRMSTRSPYDPVFILIQQCKKRLNESFNNNKKFHRRYWPEIVRALERLQKCLDFIDSSDAEEIKCRIATNKCLEIICGIEHVYKQSETEYIETLEFRNGKSSSKASPSTKEDAEFDYTRTSQDHVERDEFDSNQVHYHTKSEERTTKAEYRFSEFNFIQLTASIYEKIMMVMKELSGIEKLDYEREEERNEDFDVCYYYIQIC